MMIELLAGVLPGGAVLGMCESKKTAKSWVLQIGFGV